jgi:dienelactone hydrolase
MANNDFVASLSVPAKSPVHRYRLLCRDALLLAESKISVVSSYAKAALAALMMVSALSGCKTTDSAERVHFATAAFPGGSMPKNVWADLQKPDGPGPFPTIIVLHGCSGISSHQTQWAAKLVSWGYAAFILDSFGPRGEKEICSNPAAVRPEIRMSDIIAAVEYINEQPWAATQRIGLLGFSHGGYTTLRAVQSRFLLQESGVRAAVAYYPLCDEQRDRDIAIPTQILIGEADDWTPARLCRQLETSRSLKRPDLLQVTYYPDTYHSFDRVGLRPTKFNAVSLNGAVEPHHLEHNAAATADAEAKTKAFFDTKLKQ